MNTKTIAAAFAALTLLGAGCASDDDYRGGGLYDDEVGGAKAGSPEQVITSPETVGGRRMRPFEDSVGGSGIGPDSFPGEDPRRPDLNDNLDDMDDDMDELEDDLEEGMDDVDDVDDVDDIDNP